MACVRARLESIAAMAFLATVVGASSANPPSTPAAPVQGTTATSSSDHPVYSAAAAAGDSVCGKGPSPDEGVAVVQVCIDEKGTLTRDPEIVKTSGSCRLDEGALRLAKAGSGKYVPQKIDGKPVPGCVKFKIKFQLKDSPSDHK